MFTGSPPPAHVGVLGYGTIFAVVEVLILDLTAALARAVETQAAQLGDGEVGRPFGLDDRAIAFVLAVAQHARWASQGFPNRSFPRI